MDLWWFMKFFSCDYRHARSWTVQTFGETSPKLQSLQWPCDTRSLTLWTGTWSQQRPSIEKILSASDPRIETLFDIDSDIPSGSAHGIFILTFPSGIYSNILSDILCGIYSDMLCGIYSFWHSFWHSIWYIFGDSLWLRWTPELAVEVRRGTLWSGACGGGPAGNTLIRSLRRRSGGEHCNLALRSMKNTQSEPSVARPDLIWALKSETASALSRYCHCHRGHQVLCDRRKARTKPIP